MPNYNQWIAFDDVVLIDPTNEYISSVKVFYDDEFLINISIECDIKTPEIEREVTRLLGPGPKEMIVSRREPSLEKYRLTGIRFENTKILTYENKKIFSGRVHQVERYFENDAVGSVEFSCFWFLGSLDNLGYTRGLSVSEVSRETYEWDDFDKDEYSFDGPSNNSTSLVQFNFRGLDWLFGKVDKTIHKSASFLRTKRGVVPDDSLIFELENVLSFLFGADIIWIGKTGFNKASSPVRKVFFSNYSLGLERLYGQRELPVLPIRFSDIYTFRVDIENAINEFLGAYEKHKEHLKLDQVFWLLSYARTQAPLTRIQPMATAFDLLCTAYFEKKPNILFEKKNFEHVLRRILEVISTEIGDDPKAEELKKRAGNLNNNSINQRNKLIFQELSMEVTSLEESALKSRNTSVHGNRGSIDYIQLIKDNHAYFLLVNRLLLKLLGIESYLDYSVYGGELKNVAKGQSGTYNVTKM